MHRNPRQSPLAVPPFGGVGWLTNATNRRLTKDLAGLLAPGESVVDADLSNERNVWAVTERALYIGPSGAAGPNRRQPPERVPYEHIAKAWDEEGYRTTRCLRLVPPLGGHTYREQFTGPRPLTSFIQQRVEALTVQRHDRTFEGRTVRFTWRPYDEAGTCFWLIDVGVERWEEPSTFRPWLQETIRDLKQLLPPGENLTVIRVSRIPLFAGANVSAGPGILRAKEGSFTFTADDGSEDNYDWKVFDEVRVSSGERRCTLFGVGLNHLLTAIGDDAELLRGAAVAVGLQEVQEAP